MKHIVMKIKNFFPKKTLYRRSLAVLLAFLILVPAILIIFRPSQVAAGWFDASYGYRQKISFTHNASITSDRRITVTVDTATFISAGKMQSDCDDTRFTDINGKALDYQLTGTCNNASTTYDVVFPVIYNGANTGFIYYGNPDAKSASQNVSSFTSLAPSGGSPLVGTEEKGKAPVGWWKFDDGNGTTAKNSGTTSSANNGTLTGMASPATISSGWNNQGKFDKALNFDGVNDHVSVANESNFDFTSDFTLSVWVKTTFAGYSPIISKEVGANTGWSLGVFLGKPRILLRGTSNIDTNNEATVRIDDGNWHLVTTVNTPTSVSTYIDGVLNVTTSGTWTSTTNNEPVTIGTRNAGDFFPGPLDDVRIYNYALTNSDIKAIYNQSATLIGQDPSGTLHEGLAGYWKMDETAANTCSGGVNDSCDSSGNAKDAAWNNGAANITGKFSNAVTFDGTDDNVSASVTIPSTFTMSTWVKFDVVSTIKGIFTTSSSCGGLVLNSNNTVSLVPNDGGNANGVNSVSTVSTNTWYHITSTYDGSAARMYVNGVLEATNSNTFERPTGSSVEFGHCLGAPSRYLDGILDDVRLYNRALSPSEVAALADWAPGPVGHWTLDERTGITANDISSNANNGTLTGGPSWAAGKLGQGLQFDGVNDYVSVANESNFDFTSDFTLSVWVKTSNAGFRPIIGKYLSGVDGWDLGVWQCMPRMTIRGTSDIDSLNAAQQCIDDGKWHLVNAVNTPTSISIYIDGVFKSTTSGTWTSTTNNIPVRIGDRGSDEFFPGLIDDVRIYNYARTPKQIIQDMNAGHPAVGSPVGSALAHYKFDDGYGTTTKNSGSLGSTGNGTLTSMASPATVTSGWTNEGKLGKALLFDGTNDYVATNNTMSSLMTASEAAISIWIKPTGSSPTISGAFEGKGAIGDDGGFAGIYRGVIGGLDRIWVYNWDGNQDRIGITYSADEWTHIAWVHSNGNLFAYKNGSLVGSTPSGATQGMSNNFFIGFPYSSGLPWTGSIDEVKIYNYGLNPDEVKVEYNQGKAVVFGTLSTNPDGITASNSAARAYCPPGNTETNCAAGLNPAPVGHWTLDERTGTTANDITGNANTGTLGIGASWTSGKIGQGLLLKSDAGITVSNSPSINLNTTMAVSFWVKGTANGDFDGLMYKSDFATTGWAIHNNAGSQNKDLYIRVDTSAGTNQDPCTDYATNILNNAWHHVVFILDNGTCQVYKDGLLAGSGSYNAGSGFANSGQSFLIEEIEPDTTIDDVRMYNYAPTQSQVAWIYNRGKPIGHWKLDECTGTTAYDSSGKGNNGTITPGDTSGDNDTAGTCNSGTSTEMWHDGTSGKFNSSLGFDGTNDYVSMPNSSSLQITSQLTISAWVKRDVLDSQFREIVRKGQLYFLLINNENEFAMGIANSQYDQGYPLSGTNVWEHLVGVYDDAADSIYLYLNGNLVKTVSTGSVLTTDTTELRLGSTEVDQQFFDGLIDDIRIYNYALNATQIRTLYNEDSAVRFGPLTGSP